MIVSTTGYTNFEYPTAHFHSRCVLLRHTTIPRFSLLFILAIYQPSMCSLFSRNPHTPNTCDQLTFLGQLLWGPPSPARSFPPCNPRLQDKQLQDVLSVRLLSQTSNCPPITMLSLALTNGSTRMASCGVRMSNPIPPSPLS